MPTFRCEFDVTGDLVLPPDAHLLRFGDSAGFEIMLRNGPADAEGHATGLVAIVVGVATSIDTAQEELRHDLAEQLDLLSFTTHSRFRIVAPRRLVEWEAGQKMRNFKAFYVTDARHPPEPELTSEYLETVGVLDRAKPPAFARTALRYFRYGLLDNQPEDQFMRLWLALEIIAENVKEKDRVAILCSECDAPMMCNTCGTVATRVPMAKQAIEDLITRLTGAAGQAMSRRQFRARNGLMHGGSTESIEKECNAPLSAIVNELGALTWLAIMSTIPIDKDGPPPTFGHRDGEFTNKSLVMSVLGRFEHTGDGPHPADDKIPSAEITMLTRFGEPARPEGTAP